MSVLDAVPGSVYFRVLGLPGPQGSKSRDRHGNMFEASKKVKPWRDSVGYACELAWGKRPPLGGPVHVSIEFWMPRDAARPRSRWKANGADLDKLTRATLDGMHLPAITNSPIFGDDHQVSSLYPTKRPVARQGDPTGACITVVPLGALESNGVELGFNPVIWTVPPPINPFLNGAST